MKRVLVPEILDSLPASDPGAVAARRDLRMVNVLMGNFRWLLNRLAEVAGGHGDIVEIGAGDGTLARRVSRQLPELAPRYHALDLAPRPPDWPREAAWHQADLWSDAGASLLRRASVLVANLVLHHFDDTALRRLGGLLPQCRAILVCEPARRATHLWQARLLFPVIHRVTRHDMLVSIRAGFRGKDLPDVLGLQPDAWKSAVSTSFLGAYRLVAVRNHPAGTS